jgi:hypothetical protein
VAQADTTKEFSLGILHMPEAACTITEELANDILNMPELEEEEAFSHANHG